MALNVAGQPSVAARKNRRGWEVIYRHPLFVRLAHWINVLSVIMLLMSGMQIFNAHPMLHWGIKGADTDPFVLSIFAEEQVDGSAIGWVQIGATKFNTTGVLGVFRDQDGFLSGRAFPWWITIPSYQSLAEGRRWHFFFAWLFAFNGLAYVIYGFVSRRFKRELAPTGNELKSIGRSILDHMHIIEALEARDTKRAEELVRSHALGLAQHVERYADYLD